MLWNWNGFVATGNINVGTGVKLATTDHKVTAAGANQFCIGVAQVAPRDAQGLPSASSTLAAAANEPLQVIGPGQVAQALAGGTITVGTHKGVITDANAAFVAMTGDGTDNIVGIPLTSAASGEYFLMLVWPVAASD